MDLLLGLPTATDIVAPILRGNGAQWTTANSTQRLRLLTSVWQLGLSEEDQHQIFYANARRILNLKDPAPAPAREMAPAK